MQVLPVGKKRQQKVALGDRAGTVQRGQGCRPHPVATPQAHRVVPVARLCKAHKEVASTRVCYSPCRP